MVKKVAVYILGGSGYGGGELLRLLSQHPCVESIHAMSRKHVGEPFWRVHPNLRSVANGTFEAEPNWATFSQAETLVVFSAMPHFELAQQLPALEKTWAKHGLAERLTLIDLSGDFRLDSAAEYERAYGKPHPYPQALGTFVYGLPEWQKEKIKGAKRIASPGCFATTIQLALLPLAGLKNLGFIAVSAMTGSSGSGATPGETTHHPTRANDFRAYKVLNHQHEAEITRLLDAQGSSGYSLAFVPHSAPLVRGIFATVQLHPPAALGLNAQALKKRYEDFYRDALFMRLVEDTPRVAAVVGSNFCDIAVHEKNGNVVIMAALDNLVKGMSGQAVQNMNIACLTLENNGFLSVGYYPT
ncbi:MAG: N-acetyl-gamma-glutamyl-phosphate reductase [Gammaproteobacteria bacterium]|nr:N-acetyl-gamma-glutamyl-phosphate reductase [Gammaproteobacteria bacterium]MBU6509896.1 N-acetyl-gamma-glutamyl-phosphate reductase [Gammaproteobacteria bacterium]MDE1984289.1 N-acetyl-gamma-glutamyl-phosphate reductase [Gammaproteobacteria bacterium]MDE2461744.1 N-acetyl-gamma-glutamyl-phosphate reductase [Gammaproteobacteria bacterium]